MTEKQNNQTKSLEAITIAYGKANFASIINRIECDGQKINLEDQKKSGKSGISCKNLKIETKEIDMFIGQSPFTENDFTAQPAKVKVNPDQSFNISELDIASLKRVYGLGCTMPNPPKGSPMFSHSDYDISKLNPMSGLVECKSSFIETYKAFLYFDN